nr:retrotransposon protein, putative, Ty1-copia subclass [Tanacetum cinerariifolium]
MGKTVNELHAMLKLYDPTLTKKDHALHETEARSFKLVRSSMYVVSNKRAKLNLDYALLWHRHLGHINKKCIEKLQNDGLLNSTDLKAFEKCISYMSGKMERKPYTHQVERAKDLLRLTHTDKQSLEDLEIIQEEDMHPSIDTSLNHKEDDLEIDEPQSDIISIRRSIRTRHAPDRMCLYIDAGEHELRDLGEPTNYKAALLDPESDKWLNAMNVAMQSMKDNEVWDLVDLPPNGKIVGSKWLFKKKTDMDGAVHTFKARLVVKGFTQTYGVDYKKTFSLVVDIRAIKILIAIAAYYDYEIWKMDVKTTFLNGHLSEEVYMEKPEGASTPAELKCMQNVPYASANPSDFHWTTIKNILKYLKNTKDMFLVYEDDIKRELKVSCYTDAGNLTDADDLKSQTRYVLVLNGSAVDWKSTKQSIFAASSTEAEYIVVYDASKEAIWFGKFIFRLGVIPIIEEPINMYCDNIGAISITNESGITKGARHFRAKVHYLREVIEHGDIKLEKVHTYDNLADPFTKE